MPRLYFYEEARFSSPPVLYLSYILCTFIFHQDNAPAHKSVLAMGKLKDLHYELLEHPPYSTDLALSDFSLFPKLKLFLAGQRFSSNQEAIAAVEGYLADYEEPTQARDNCTGASFKCISLRGDC